jgi:PAS domain S-box-containing protein
MPYPTPLFDETGALTGAVNVLVDIGERKQVEQERQRLAAIVDSSDDAIVSKDLCGIITSWNPGAERLFGYAAEEMIGKSITLLIPPNLLQEETGILERVASGQRVEHFETTRLHKDGTPVRISITVSPIRNAKGMVVGASKIARDITERKLAEQALTERNAQLALAGQAALVGSYAYDVNKGTMQVSEGYVAIHGLPAGTTETSYSEWRARVHPEDLGWAEGSRNQAFANLWREDKGEYRIVLSTGEVRWIERRGSISYGENGCPERVVGVNIDVTERKRAEERQRLLVAELNHRVKNTLATVSSVVSHTAIGSRSVANFVAALDGRIRSMASTQELLSSSRWQGISLTELIRRELAPYATSHNVKISGAEVVLRPEAGQAMAMVLHELATNAAKYGALSAKAGSVSIRWDRRLNGQPSCLVLEWQEIGGPPVLTPNKSGFGTRTIRDLVPYELGGTVDLTLPPEGARCRIKLPADWVSSDGEPIEASAHAHTPVAHFAILRDAVHTVAENVSVDVSRMLKGEKPADLPVIQITKVE